MIFAYFKIFFTRKIGFFGFGYGFGYTHPYPNLEPGENTGTSVCKKAKKFTLFSPFL